MNEDKPIKQLIAVVIFNEDRSKVLLVKRPDAPDERFPGMWSLPAGTLHKDESHKNAVKRTGQQKLGVEVEIVKLLGEESADRGKYVTHMKEYEVKIVKGKPSCPQPYSGMTQYNEWKWGTAHNLKKAEKAGSLCSSIFLKMNS